MDPDNPPPPTPETGGGESYNPHRQEQNNTTTPSQRDTINSDVSGINSRMKTTIEKRNKVVLYGDDLNNLEWTVEDKAGVVLGASSGASEQVVISVKNLSNEGMTVGIAKNITEGSEVLVKFKYDYVPFSAKGKFTIVKKNSAYLKFDKNTDDVSEKMINFIKSKKSGKIEHL